MSVTVNGGAPSAGQKQEFAQAFDLARVATSGGSVVGLVGPDGGVISTKRVTRNRVITIGDSRLRQAITPSGSISRISAYSVLDWASFLLHGKLKTIAAAGNIGYDIYETLADIDNFTPSNNQANTGAIYGLQNVDLNDADIAVVHLGINHFTAFNFALATEAEREAINAPIRAQIQAAAQALIKKLSPVGYIVWVLEPPVGPASTNFVTGVSKDYPWHIQWFNEMITGLKSANPTLITVDVGLAMIDPTSANYVPAAQRTLGSSAAATSQDMHPTAYGYYVEAQKLIAAITPIMDMTAKPSYPVAASEVLSATRTSSQIGTDPLMLATPVATGCCFSNAVSSAATTTGVFGTIIPGVRVKTSATGTGQATVTANMIACPSGFGKAIQVDIEAVVDLLGMDLGIQYYDIGTVLNTAIGVVGVAGVQNIQTTAYVKAGFAGASDGLVVDGLIGAPSMTSRVRSAVSGGYSTGYALGTANNTTDYSVKTGALQFRQFEGALKAPVIVPNALTTIFQTNSTASPNANCYIQIDLGKVDLLAGQKVRFIVGNLGVYVAPMRSDSLLVDIC